MKDFARIVSDMISELCCCCVCCLLLLLHALFHRSFSDQSVRHVSRFLASSFAKAMSVAPWDRQPSRPKHLGCAEDGDLLCKAVRTKSLVGRASWKMGLELLDFLQVSAFPPNIINYLYGRRGSGFVPLLAQMAMIWVVDLRKQFRALFACMSKNVGVRQAGVTISV